MKRILVLLFAMTILVHVSCDWKDEQTKDGQAERLIAQATCPVCKHKMKEDAYCACCTAVATLETEPVHCDTCDKDFTPGTYCAACNRFMFNAKVKCGNCQDQVPKGHYCSEEKLYKGLADIAYCETCKKPYHKSLPCPNCN
jgi:hypothetical protein